MIAMLLFVIMKSEQALRLTLLQLIQAEESKL